MASSGDTVCRADLLRLFAAGGSATVGVRFAADREFGTFGAAVSSSRPRDRFGAAGAGACSGAARPRGDRVPGEGVTFLRASFATARAAGLFESPGCRPAVFDASDSFRSTTSATARLRPATGRPGDGGSGVGGVDAGASATRATFCRTGRRRCCGSPMGLARRSTGVVSATAPPAGTPSRRRAARLDTRGSGVGSGVDLAAETAPVRLLDCRGARRGGAGGGAAFAATACPSARTGGRTGGSETATLDDGTAGRRGSSTARATGSPGADGAALLPPRRRRTGSYVSSRPTQKWCFRIVGSATTVMTGSTNSSAG
jgi:hypothetical protein